MLKGQFDITKETYENLHINSDGERIALVHQYGNASPRAIIMNPREAKELADTIYLILEKPENMSWNSRTGGMVERI